MSDQDIEKYIKTFKILLLLVFIAFFIFQYVDISNEYEKISEKILDPESRKEQERIDAYITIEKDYRNSMEIECLSIEQEFLKEHTIIWMWINPKIIEENPNNSFTIDFSPSGSYVLSNFTIKCDYTEFTDHTEEKDLEFEVVYEEKKKNKIIFDFSEAPKGDHSLHLFFMFPPFEYLEQEYGTFDILNAINYCGEIRPRYELEIPEDYIISTFREINLKHTPLTQMEKFPPLYIENNVQFDIRIRKNTTREMFEISYRAVKLAILIAVMSFVVYFFDEIFIFLIKKIKKTKKGDLIDIKGVGKKRAEKLENAGIKTIEELLSSEIKEIAGKTGFSKKMIEKFKKEAKEIKGD